MTAQHCSTEMTQNYLSLLSTMLWLGVQASVGVASYQLQEPATAAEHTIASAGRAPQSPPFPYTPNIGLLGGELGSRCTQTPDSPQPRFVSDRSKAIDKI
ncbi:hypothetical protein HaLaN_25344 [Haematococcus lacustris]|uniref:Uncharacterized protein n=1 Tax=Haematococcus lacustris TaxID=44745 RepID=A0A699ZXB5_HAELA|nr:hypothetical protein HaLaN_25344 [Haematococcus lacustris]